MDFIEKDMKKIGIVAESQIQYIRFIQEKWPEQTLINGISKDHHYINFNDFSSVHGIELETFYFASDRLKNMYHFFKKIESRVR